VIILLIIVIKNLVIAINMKKYSNTIIDSTLIYLEELQYRANNDKSWVDALYSL